MTGLLQAPALGSGVSLPDKSYFIILFKIWLYTRAALVYRCFVYVCFGVKLLISRFFSVDCSLMFRFILLICLLLFVDCAAYCLYLCLCF